MTNYGIIMYVYYKNNKIIFLWNTTLTGFIEDSGALAPEHETMFVGLY